MAILLFGWTFLERFDRAGYVGMNGRLRRRVCAAKEERRRIVIKITAIEYKLQDPMTLPPEYTVLELSLTREQQRLEEARREVERRARELHEYEIKELT